MKLAAVALSEAVRSYDKLYDYILSPEDSDKAAPGMRVLIPFGPKNRLKSAWIIKLKEEVPAKKLKVISRLVDNTPLISQELIKLAEWIKTRYFCTWGDALRLMIPAGVNLRKQKIYRVISEPDSPVKVLSESPARLYNMLLESKSGLSEQELGSDEQIRKDLDELIEKGFAEITEIFEQRINEKMVRAVTPAISKEEFDGLMEAGKVRNIRPVRVMEMLYADEICTLQDLLLIPGVSHATIRSMAKKGWVSYCDIEVERNPFSTELEEQAKPLMLTDEQQRILDKAIPSLNRNKRKELLIHGITGSGKTEIYIRIIAAAVDMGKTAIVLVPEISLTPQMTNRFTSRFGHRVAIQHSRLSQGERYDQWRKIMAGEIDVVIGARSAVFAPLSNLGVIVIDEEHELTYKSENTPKYDARNVARARCNMNGALLVFGSATPSVETYFRAVNGKISLETIKTRPNDLPLPETIQVDLRDELKEGNRSILSRLLEKELIKNKERGEQSILFINRRGYASFLLCRDCGFTLKCPHCSVSLTVHTHDKKAICHYCGYSANIPQICPDCHGSNIKDFGIGTQKVEEELKRHPAGFRTLRMDLDTTGGKHGHKKILDAFRKKEADVLIGTQMVAKGHDFPDVTLVGIVAADATLFTGDYRASERTFQLITQASGRAGRGAKPGKVILQAYNVDDYAVLAAMSQDYETFYQKEILMRKTMLSPPFCHLGLIIVSGENPDAAKESINRVRKSILERFGGSPGFQISKPLPAPVFVIRNRARWRLIIKMASVNKLVQLMGDVLDAFPGIRVHGTDVSVDIDPAGMV